MIGMKAKIFIGITILGFGWFVFTEREPRETPTRSERDIASPISNKTATSENPRALNGARISDSSNLIAGRYIEIDGTVQELSGVKSAGGGILNINAQSVNVEEDAKRMIKEGIITPEQKESYKLQLSSVLALEKADFESEMTEDFSLDFNSNTENKSNNGENL